MRIPSTAAAALTAALSVAPLAALAADDPAGERSAERSDWSVTLGAFGAFVPEYEGSDDYEFVPFPLVDIVWRDRLFLSSRKGAGGYFLNEGGFRLGGSVGYDFGRDEEDGDRLEGLGDIDGGATVNLLAEYEIHGFKLASRFTHQFTGDDTGYLVDLGLGYAFRLPRGVVVEPSITTEYASGDYMSAYFGVSSAQSARSGHPSFDADSGFKSFGPELLVVYPVTRSLSLQGTAAYKRLLGDAADSPVTEDADQFSVGLGVAYRF